MLRTLSKKEIKELNKKVSKYNLSFDVKSRIQKIGNIFLQEGNPILFEIEGQIYPTLKNTNLALPRIYVDRGAIPFIIKGADLMRPGVVSTESFEKGSLVLIADAEHKKNLALGIALLNSQEIIALNKGKIIKNIHYINDSIWNFSLKK